MSKYVILLKFVQQKISILLSPMKILEQVVALEKDIITDITTDIKQRFYNEMFKIRVNVAKNSIFLTETNLAEDNK